MAPYGIGKNATNRRNKKSKAYQLDRKLKVLISGTGFAGQGHTDAFRAVGADVVGIVGRTASVVSKVAKKMAIPYSGTDWQQALKDCQPDIVSIATPGGAHYET